MTRRLCILALVVLAASCSRPSSYEYVDSYPGIFPDYVGVTIPDSIPDLQFRMEDRSCFEASRERVGDTVFVKVCSWNKGDKTGREYKPFPIFISHDPIDPYVAYRLIEPGYESWNYITLSQRELSSYKESVMVDNKVNGNGCLNCHCFDAGNPDRMLFHARGKGGGTVFVDGDSVRLRNLAAEGPHKQGVYPAWHPDGRYIVFSSNATHQAFSFADAQPIEVYDDTSDLILVDTATDSITVPAALGRGNVLETFPSWSPDGGTLYYCAASAAGKMPESRANLHYNLMAIDFRDGTFVGEPRTVFSADSLSVSFPRACGNYLLFTVSAYATFPIWHREADLWLLDLRTGEASPASVLNSPDTESYHSWSSNGRWIVFSSRRLDGRYTRLFLAHFEGEGNFGKPWLLPQKNPEHNLLRLRSYNVPEFVTGKVQDRRRALSKLFGR